MSTASKSPRKVAAVALEVGSRTLPRYSRPCSRHDFTLPQLFACLVLRKFFKAGYRDVCAILNDCPALREQIGLKKTPHFTTLQKAELKLLRDPVIRRMLTQTIDLYHGVSEDDPPNTCHEVSCVAVDSTGFEVDHASRYFIRRRSRSPGLYQTTTYRWFGKLNLAVDTENHLILSTHRGRGPRPDVDELLPLMDGFCPNVIPGSLVGDAGFDSEANHVLLREYLGITSVIPPKIGRPTQELPTGKWRWLMAVEFDEALYGQRWQSETVMYMLKCHQGEALTARKYQTRRREMGLMCVTHNIMIVYLEEGFLQGMSG